MLSMKKMKGAEIAKELEARKGHKPSPGTIYPALKDLKKKGLIKADENKVYSLTPKGKKELHDACTAFFKMFHDMKDMKKMCKCCDI
jgi:DNA-binding PadR family transcriptional regulator